MSEVMQRARGIFKGAGFSSLDDAVFSFAMLLAKAKLSEFEEEGVISNVNTAISRDLKEMPRVAKRKALSCGTTTLLGVSQRKLESSGAKKCRGLTLLALGYESVK